MKSIQQSFEKNQFSHFRSLINIFVLSIGKKILTLAGYIIYFLGADSDKRTALFFCL